MGGRRAKAVEDEGSSGAAGRPAGGGVAARVRAAAEGIRFFGKPPRKAVKFRAPGPDPRPRDDRDGQPQWQSPASSASDETRFHIVPRHEPAKCCPGARATIAASVVGRIRFRPRRAFDVGDDQGGLRAKPRGRGEAGSKAPCADLSGLPACDIHQTQSSGDVSSPFRKREDEPNCAGLKLPPKQARCAGPVSVPEAPAGSRTRLPRPRASRTDIFEIVSCSAPTGPRARMRPVAIPILGTETRTRHHRQTGWMRYASQRHGAVDPARGSARPHPVLGDDRIRVAEDQRSMCARHRRRPIDHGRLPRMAPVIPAPVSSGSRSSCPHDHAGTRIAAKLAPGIDKRGRPILATKVSPRRHQSTAFRRNRNNRFGASWHWTTRSYGLLRIAAPIDIHVAQAFEWADHRGRASFCTRSTRLGHRRGTMTSDLAIKAGQQSGRPAARSVVPTSWIAFAAAFGLERCAHAVRRGRARNW